MQDETTAATGETTMGVDKTTGESGISSGPAPECMENGDCGSNQACQQGECVDACGGAWGEGSYGYCLTEYGGLDTDDLCGPEHVCIYWEDGTGEIEQTACALQGCVSACDCPPPPSTGDAVVACGEIGNPVSTTDCYLSCEDGEPCPDGMDCNASGVCATGVSELSMYGDCGNVAANCAAPGFCVNVPGGETACTMSCTDVTDCPLAVPPGGTASPACTDIVPGVPGFECFLDCIGGGIPCPDGMLCINGTLCMWPD